MLAGAGIAAGGQLLAELLRQKFQAEQAKQERLNQAEQQGFEAQKEGAGALAKNQQDALAQMLAAYRQSLMGG